MLVYSRIRKKPSFALAILILLCSFVSAQDVLFPEGSGIINVKKAPYFAKGDGQTDDTEAIQAALSAFPNGNRIIYLPAGTYLISHTLSWPAGSGGNEFKRTILQGQHRKKSVIKLQDNAIGFQDQNSPTSMIYTGKAPAQRFGNEMRDLTISIGRNNPGATGVRFISNNHGTIRNVIIRSEDENGVVGLDMAYTDEIGPLLVKNLLVEGFDRGIDTRWQVNSVTFEDIELRNQKKFGWRNYHQQINVHNLYSYNEVPAIYNEKDGNSSLAITNAYFEGFGEASSAAAIWNQKNLYIRNAKMKGYGKLINNDDKGRDCGDISEDTLEEHHSHCNIHSLFDSPNQSLGLPVKEVPTVPWDDPASWKSPLEFGAVGDGKTDDTEAVQAALNSGATTVYFDGGKKFFLSGKIRISGKVRRIIGLRGVIIGNCEFIVEDSGPEDTPILVFESMRGSYGYKVELVHQSARTVVMNNLAEITPRGKGSGDFFLNDVVCHAITFSNPNQHIWCRQLNVETGDQTKIVNDGATLWILGLKTERGETVLETKNKGRTEVIGGLIYSTTGEKVDPIFVIDEAYMSVQGVVERNFNNFPYQDWVKETRRGETRILKRGDLKSGGNFWYIGYGDDYSPQKNSPPTVTFISPIENQVFTKTDSIPIKLLVSDLDKDSVTAYVYLEEDLITTLTSASYSMIWKPQQEVVYQLKAVAVDAEEAKSDTSVVSFSVENPTGSVCKAPDSIWVEKFVSTSVSLKWTPSFFASSYRLRYRRQETDQWEFLLGISDTTVIIENLDKESLYKWAVGADCDSNQTLWTFSSNFQTEGFSLEAVDNLNFSFQSPKVFLSWTDMSELETGFIIERKTPEDTFTPIDTLPANSSLFIDSLGKIGPSYIYRVKTYHPDFGHGISEEVSIQTGLTTYITRPHLSKEILLYPNPTDNFITVENIVGTGRIQWWSMHGRMMNESIYTFSSKNVLTIPDSLTSGVYLLNIIRDSGNTYTRKIELQIN
ncbi:MAG: glycosyl hydrolase family 28-related protein [Bacteroidota bacterium]